MCRIPCRASTSICSWGSWEISSAKALRRIIESRPGCRRRLVATGLRHDSSSPKNRQGPVETARRFQVGYGCDAGETGSIRARASTGRSVMATLWAFLIYWLVVFVGCYVVIGDRSGPALRRGHAPRRAQGGGRVAPPRARCWRRSITDGPPASFDSMFTTNIIWTVFQAIVWFGVFTLIFQFHPWHALGLGIATMLLVQGLATMGVNSMLTPTPGRRSTPAAAVNKPVRQSLAPPRPAAPPRPRRPRRSSEPDDGLGRSR